MFDKTMEINFTGVVNGLVPLVQTMIEKGGGQISVVSSVAGYGGLPKSSAYGASKAALINMMESLRFDLKGTNIKVQLINPGFGKDEKGQGDRKQRAQNFDPEKN